MSINSWQELCIIAQEKWNISIDDIKNVLRFRFGSGGSATREYDKWYDYLEMRMEYRQKDKLLAEWDMIWNRLSEKPPMIRIEWSIREMKEHIERYKNETNI